MSNRDEQKLFQDWKEFLQSDRADLRAVALENVLKLRTDDTIAAAGSEESMLHRLQTHLLEAIVRNVSFPDLAVSMKALRALVYLTSSSSLEVREEQQHGIVVDELWKHNIMGRLMEVALSSKPNGGDQSQSLWNEQVNWCMALLVNLTRTERGCIEFMGKTLPDQAVPSSTNSSEAPDGNVQLPPKPTLELLLSRFLSNQYIQTNRDRGDEPAILDYLVLDEEQLEHLDTRSEDPYQHFGAVLMNATQTEAGRRFVMRIIYPEKDTSSATTSVLQKLLPILSHIPKRSATTNNNPIRRRGIAGLVKNCCLETESAFWLLHDVKVMNHLLYPLAGPEELDLDEKRGMLSELWLEGPDKIREPDKLTRLYLVESILLLCATGRKSRDFIRLQRTYVILKWADMVEESEIVSERIDEVVQYLRRDEEGTVEGSSDALVEDQLKTNEGGHQKLLLPASAVAINPGTDMNYDDVD